MKKLVAILAIMFALLKTNKVSAQQQMTPLLDTNTNTETNNIASANILTQGYGDISLQYVGTKLSGTISGKVYLQGTIDGTNYTTVDSLVLADVTTNTKTFDITSKKRSKWRFSIVTSGSMSLVNKGYWTQMIKP